MNPALPILKLCSLPPFGNQFPHFQPCLNDEDVDVETRTITVSFGSARTLLALQRPGV